MATWMQSNITLGPELSIRQTSPTWNPAPRTPAVRQPDTTAMLRGLFACSMARTVDEGTPPPLRNLPDVRRDVRDGAMQSHVLLNKQ
jgi:hypothetical protein